jgi:dolichol-phosphate mannosyltransferase
LSRDEASQTRPAADGAGASARTAPELTIVIPTFKEITNVPILVGRLRAGLSGVEWEAIFVDDDSPDGTAAEVRRIGMSDARVRCIRRIRRRGLAGACIEGMLASQAPYIAVMDADLQHDEKMLAAMLEKIRSEELDLVVGSRYLGGHVDEGFGRFRSQMSARATGIASKLLGIRLSDPMSGFFMIRREVFEALAPKLSSQGFKILLDIVATAGGELRTAEVPYVFRNRLHGESKLDTQVALDYLALLLAKATDDVVSIRFLSFCLIGISGLGVHMMALLAAQSVLGMDFTAAQISATILAITSNYILNNFITYSDLRLRGWHFVLGWIKFMVICGFGAISNIGVAYWIYSNSNGEWTIAALAGAAISVFWNFMVSAIFVWRLR